MNSPVYSNKTKKSLSLFSVMVIMAVILAACAPAATPTPSASSGSPATIGVATDPTLGQILVDSKGMTLYVFTKDSPNTSNCDATCQATWPPLVSSGTPKAGPGVNAGLIGTATLSNGEKIATYDNRPLYYKATDKKAGDKTGEDFNNVWFVVSPAGQPVTGMSSATPTTAQSPAAATPTTAPTPATVTPTSTPMAVTEPTIDVANNPTLGNILVANNGMTLYAYAEDTADTSNCGAACQKTWPPVYTLGHPNLGTGVTASMIGTAKLANGNMIVTYNHMPLYYFITDTASGKTTGQGFDNAWFAVSPDGNIVGNQAEVTINIGTNSTLGSYLVDGTGIAMYTYTKDTADTSTCTGACRANWPLVLTLGKPTLGPGVDPTMVGTIKLPDSSMMVTYNHMPLYYFVGDATPTQIKGQGTKNVWYVIGPDGKQITTVLPAPASN